MVEQKTLMTQDYETRKTYALSMVSLVESGEELTPNLLWRLYYLFAQSELWAEDRQAALETLYFKKKPSIYSTNQIEDRDIALSAIKDALHIGSGSNHPKAEQFVNTLTQRFSITDKQLSFLKSWTQWENDLLIKLGTRGAAVSEQDMPIELAKKAASVGIPITVLYFSGSVVGLSAAGITSGLASLGLMSGLVTLGLNPMTAGVAVLIACGIAVKKVLDCFFSSSEEDEETEARRVQLEKEKRRLEELHRRCMQMIADDSESFAVGHWWEFLSSRRSKRQLAVSMLKKLCEDKGAVPEGAQ